MRKLSHAGWGSKRFLRARTTETLRPFATRSLASGAVPGGTKECSYLPISASASSISTAISRGMPSRGAAFARERRSRDLRLAPPLSGRPVGSRLPSSAPRTAASRGRPAADRRPRRRLPAAPAFRLRQAGHASFGRLAFIPPLRFSMIFFAPVRLMEGTARRACSGVRRSRDTRKPRRLARSH